MDDVAVVSASAFVTDLGMASLVVPEDTRTDCHHLNLPRRPHILDLLHNPGHQDSYPLPASIPSL